MDGRVGKLGGVGDLGKPGVLDVLTDAAASSGEQQPAAKQLAALSAVLRLAPHAQPSMAWGRTHFSGNDWRIALGERHSLAASGFCLPGLDWRTLTLTARTVVTQFFAKIGNRQQS